MIKTPFGHVETWIFDLDNTLYPPDERLFRQIEARISVYLQRELGVDKAEADHLRRLYWHDHGTTLAGLMLHHRIDPDPFLAEVHDIDFSVLSPDLGLHAAISALPGRKIVYTNGADAYAHKVLHGLGLSDLFEDVWSIEHAFYTAKPAEAAYRRIFGADGLNPARAAFFEDDPRNLEAPHAMGTVTVLVQPALTPAAQVTGPRSAPDMPAAVPWPKAAALLAEARAHSPITTPPAPETPAYVDFVTPDLTDFLSRLSRGHT